MALALLFGILGGVLGAVAGGPLAAIAGALAGGALGWRMTASARRATPTMPAYGVRDGTPGAAATHEVVLARLEAIESRLARLEDRLGIERASASPAPASEVAPVPVAARAAPATDADSPATVSSTANDEASVPAYLRGRAAVARTHVPDSRPAPLAAGVAKSRPTLAAWSWFTGGNAMTRIGVVALFFGVAFLLRWFTEHFTVPIEWRLAGVALAGLALLAIGLAVARARPAYGLALQGAGAGVLYLVAFAAFRLYGVLAPVPAFALLLVVAAGSVVLALHADSQAMAALAFAGGFLAPVLVSPGTGEPLPLFSYMALLNGAVLLIAWRRAWRWLNALGFLFTFALALVWGWQYYAPRHFAVVEPFLALFFAAYVAIAILEAARSDVSLARPVDALLVFGVPATAFALQHGLVRDVPHGMAWSAGALALVYAALALAIRRRPGPGLPLLARAFVALAVVFATLAIPFALDARHTAAWWALEAAGAYWLGCRQPSVAVRAFALLLQVGAAAFVLAAGPYPGERAWFANAGYAGAAMIATAALASTLFADRHPDALQPAESAMLPWLFAWGVLWWAGAGFVEITDRLAADTMGHAFLAYVAAGAIAACVLRRVLRWPRLAWLGLALLPAMAIVAYDDLDRVRTTLVAYGAVAWPLAWVALWLVLEALEPATPTDAARGSRHRAFLDGLHVVAVVLLVVHAAWEAGEWTGRRTPEGTSWITAASAMPAIAYLAAIARLRDTSAWPVAAHREAYAVTAATVVAALLAAWFVLANVLSPGDASPLPYVPLANPLDVALALAVASGWTWATRCATLDERVRYAVLGLALFVALNGVVVRTVHHTLEVPWRLGALAASKPLQSALTLAWTATALPLMFVATRRRVRPLWMIGAALLALVVVKLFALDLGALSGLPRVVAFLGVGVLLLVIGYVAPLPPQPGSGSH